MIQIMPPFFNHKCWSSVAATRDYFDGLIQSDPPMDKLIISFTGMGAWEAERGESKRASGMDIGDHERHRGVWLPVRLNAMRA